MNWLENNPFGVLLAAVGGVLLSLVLLLAWAWNWPVESGSDASEAGAQGSAAVPQLDSELGPLSEYQVVNNRPIFNETRRPQIAVEEEEPAPVEIVEPEVSEAPEVRLTGVVITPEVKIVTLTPNEEGEAIILREGMPLEGDYFGWSVNRVDSRAVTLKSAKGESLLIDLAIHDAVIAEPPKPEPVVTADEGEDAEAGEPLSRAEEIRQRIQDRREQLRREAEQEEEEEQDRKAGQGNEYQQAIREMINRKRNNEKEPEDDEG